MPESATRTHPDQLTKIAVTDSLRRAGAALDELWLSAASDGIDEEVRLAEASQAIHRALIALSQPI